jgi:hypothetical protein
MLRCYHDETRERFLIPEDRNGIAAGKKIKKNERNPEENPISINEGDVPVVKTKKEGKWLLNRL